MRALYRAKLEERQAPAYPNPAFCVENGRRVEALTGRTKLGSLTKKRFVQFKNEFFRCVLASGTDDMKEILRRFNSVDGIVSDIPEPLRMALEDRKPNGYYTENALDTIYAGVRVVQGNANHADVLQARGQKTAKRGRGGSMARARGNLGGPFAAVKAKVYEAAERKSVRVKNEDLPIILEFLTEMIVETECFNLQLSDQLFDFMVGWWNVLP